MADGIDVGERRGIDDNDSERGGRVVELELHTSEEEKEAVGWGETEAIGAGVEDRGGGEEIGGADEESSHVQGGGNSDSMCSREIEAVEAGAVDVVTAAEQEHKYYCREGL
ncbi:hypothetical protein M5689_018983 [Euphorbia peplus]|nr:hypothetical protein M5689_018983 [Euphorbia peplus]